MSISGKVSIGTEGLTGGLAEGALPSRPEDILGSEGLKVCLDFRMDTLLNFYFVCARLVMKYDMQISYEMVSNAHVQQLTMSL